MYDFILEFLVGKWSDFINSFSPDEIEMEAAKKVQTLFENQYFLLGTVMLVIVLITWALYYFWLNSLPGLFYKSRYWIVAGMLSTIFTGVATFFIIKLQVNINIPFTKYLAGIVVINCVYSFVTYFILSVVFNSLTNAKTTPLKLF